VPIGKTTTGSPVFSLDFGKIIHDVPPYPGIKKGGGEEI
jgi:hypothetical protein